MRAQCPKCNSGKIGGLRPFVDEKTPPLNLTCGNCGHRWTLDVPKLLRELFPQEGEK